MSTEKKVPMRKCVGCGEMKSKKEMMRVLKTLKMAIPKEVYESLEREFENIEQK